MGKEEIDDNKRDEDNNYEIQLLHSKLDTLTNSFNSEITILTNTVKDLINIGHSGHNWGDFDNSGENNNKNNNDNNDKRNHRVFRAHDYNENNRLDLGLHASQSPFAAPQNTLTRDDMYNVQQNTHNKNSSQDLDKYHDLDAFINEQVQVADMVQASKDNDTNNNGTNASNNDNLKLFQFNPFNLNHMRQNKVEEKKLTMHLDRALKFKSTFDGRGDDLPVKALRFRRDIANWVRRSKIVNGWDDNIAIYEIVAALSGPALNAFNACTRLHTALTFDVFYLHES